MLLRSRDPSRHKTHDQRLKEDEKFCLRVLEECKQIPKGDRLQIRKMVQANNKSVINIFHRFHDTQSNSDSYEDMQQLQKNLRKIINDHKQQNQKEMIDEFKRSMVSSPRYQTLLNSNIKLTESKPTLFSSSINQENIRPIKTPQKTQRTGELTSTEKKTMNKLLGRTTLTDQPRSLMNSVSSKQLTTQPDVEKYKSIQPTFDSRNSSVFSDPKLLEECREILSRVSVTGWSVADRWSDVDPRAVFGTKEAETVMEYFFQGEQELTKESFVFRLGEYMRLNLPTNGYTRQSASRYFDVLSDDRQVISIGRFGLVLDQYCLKMIPVHEIRKIFNQIDACHSGFVGRGAIIEDRWTQLFDRADLKQKGIISYWDLFGVRKSWEMVSFIVWHNQHQVAKEICQIFD